MVRAKCSKCGGKRADVRPNWKEKPGMPDGWQGRSARRPKIVAIKIADKN